MSKCDGCKCEIGSSYMVHGMGPCAKCGEMMGEGEWVPAVYLGIYDDDGYPTHTFRLHRSTRCPNCHTRGVYAMIRCKEYPDGQEDHEEVYRQIFGIPVERYAR